MKGFEHIHFPPGFFIKHRTLNWVDGPHITFNPNEQIPEQIRNLFTKQLRICNADGECDNACKTIQDLIQRINHTVLGTIMGREDIKSMDQDTEMNVKYLSREIGDFYLDIKGEKLHLKEALIQGNVKWDEKTKWPEFKVLIKEGELSPYIGCAITELSDGNLIGFTLSHADRSLKLINIPLGDRNRR